MEIIWDTAKADLNYHKHGVRFSDAEAVLFDDNALTIEDPDSETEQRFVTLGIDALGRILIVVHSFSDDQIRIISARKASPGERSRYEKEL